MAEYVDFHYVPLEGKITGKQVLKQTEDAINDLGQHVYEIDIDNELIQHAIDTSNQAIDTAEAALSAVTTNRAMWFNTVAEMKATDIALGITAATRGKGIFNDGDGAFYAIRAIKGGDVDSDDTVFLDNGNVAERIKQFNLVAKGNNIVYVANVADLRASDAVAGLVYGTTGYYAPNDGGAGVYTIRTATLSDVDDGGSIIILDNGNVAELITDGTVNVKQFGAKGDGVTDDTNAFQKLDGRIAYIPEGTYIVSSVMYGADTAIDGAGMGRTIIKQTQSCDDDMITFNNAPRCQFTNLSLWGRGYDDGENPHTYLYQALLKILATNNADTYSNSWCVFEHLSIRFAPMNGMIVLGSSTGAGSDPQFYDTKYPVTGYNWVHQFNDIRVEKCKRWCVIDSATDNKWSNVYWSDGDVGCAMMQGGGTNLYSNLKIDQPYSQGANGTESGYADGACLLMRYVSYSIFVNLDVQSAFYAGIKVYYCRGLMMDGSINNCGRWSPDGGTCLMIDYSNYCDFRFSFYAVNYTQARNISITSNCFNIKCYATEIATATNINGRPSSCFIIDETKKLSSFYNSEYEKTSILENLLQNPLCESTTGWTLASNVTLDTNSMVVGTNSFAMQGVSGASQSARQTVTGLKPNTFYAFACVVNIVSLNTLTSTTPTPYLQVVNAGGSDYLDNLGYHKAENSLGKHFIFKVGKTNDTGSLDFRCVLYNCNTTAYAGNFIAFCISGDYPGGDTITGWKNVYNQIKTQMDNTTMSVTYDINSNNTLSLIKMLIDK